MKEKIRQAGPEEIPEILAWLRKNPVQYAFVLQDLLRWSKTSKFYYVSAADELSFLHVSGHPAHNGHKVIILGGKEREVQQILDFVKPQAPFVVRETAAHLRTPAQNYFPAGKLYLETRMDVSAETFQPKHKGLARQLTVEDAPLLAAFFRAPPQAAGSFLGWIHGSRAFFGLFEDEKLVSMASTLVSIPEAWTLVSIETLKEYRGRGYASEVTSSVIARGLQDTKVVSLSAVSDNSAAISVYKKLGFRAAEDRLWLDCGAGLAP